MSDVSIVVVGVIGVLSGVGIVAWIARPSEFRSVRFAAPERHPRYIAVEPLTAPKVRREALPDVRRDAVPDVRREALGDVRLASPRTITRGASDQGSFWAKPPSYAPTSTGASERGQDHLEAGSSDPRR
jgi:hypothetical protein